MNRRIWKSQILPLVTKSLPNQYKNEIAFWLAACYTGKAKTIYVEGTEENEHTYLNATSRLLEGCGGEWRDPIGYTGWEALSAPTHMKHGFSAIVDLW